MTIIKRAEIGRPLTWDELDNNFSQVDALVTTASGAVQSAVTQAQAASDFASAASTSATEAATTAGNIQQSLTQISKNTTDITSLTQAVAVRAMSGANTDITSLQGLTTALSPEQGGTGAKTVDGARVALNAASRGVNSDITKLKGLAADGTVSIEELLLTTGEKAINLTSANTTGVSFGVESTNGGASVFHNFCKYTNGAAIPDKFLTGGYGARPWDGTKYTGHSNAAIHFLQDGNATATNHGGWIRFMVTPLNSTIDNRYSPFAISNNGDTYMGRDVPFGTFNGKSLPANFTDYDGRGLKQIVSGVNEINLLTPANGVLASTNLRTSLCGGTLTAPTAMKSGYSSYVSISGYDGTLWTPAAAAVQINVPADWSTVSRPTEIIFSTTKTGTTNRANRWLIQNDGHFVPSDDNAYSIGLSQKRVTAIYAVNGTIQTSDARLKTSVRKMSQDEVNAAKLLSKEIGIWEWLTDVQGSARENNSFHVGMTVQRAMEILTQCNLNWKDYSFIIYEQWEEESTVVSYSADGETPEIVVTPAGDRYSFAPDQLNLFIARGIEARLSALEGE